MFKAVKKEKSLLIPQEILKRVSQKTIYEKILGQEIHDDIVVCNTIRGEKNPSMKINIRDNIYLHIDFGNSKYRGNCFNLVQQKYNDCSFHEALVIIDKMFNLGLMTNSPITPSIDISNINMDTNKTDRVNKNYKVKFTYKNRWDKEAVEYWDQYKISVDYLKRENVYQIKDFWLGVEQIPYNGVGFAYYEPDIDKTKIYLPQNKVNGRRKKFYTDVPFNYMSKKNLINTSLDTPTLVCKSKKDEFVTNLFYKKTTSVQCESFHCFTEENRKTLRDTADNIFIFFGSDEQGKRESIALTTEYNYNYLNIPNQYLEDGINDIAEMIKNTSEDKVREFLEQKIKL